MTAEGFALGVDLGTSHTVAVLRWPDGRTRPLLFDGVPLLPSAVYLDPNGALHVGRDALRMAALDPARLEPNPKRRIDEATVLLGRHEVSTVDVLAAVLAAVARAAVEAVGFLPPAVLTYPAAWGPTRRAVLAGAAAKAGWPPPRLVPEPVAAARYFADVLRRPVPVRASIAVFDFGAGTLDVAVVQNTGNGFAVLGAGGIENLGGLDVDAALVDHLGRLLGGTAPGAWAALAHPDTTARLRDRYRFWDDVRGAKEMLSRTPVAPVPVPGQDQAVHLTREELDRVAGPLIMRAVQETGAVIHRCGLRPDQLAGLFLVGGSSRLPIVARQLHAQLGIAPTVLEQPELPVAEGALAEPVPMPVVASAPPAPAPMSPPPPPPARRPWYRRRLAWVAAGAAVALLAAATVVTLLLHNPYPEVSFTEAAQVARVDTGSDASLSTAFTAVSGDRAYLAWTKDQKLQVTGYDLAAKKPTGWHTAVGATGSSNWEGLVALPDGVLAVGYQGGDQPRTVYGVRWSDGHPWQRPLSRDDVVIPEPGVVVVTDTHNHKVLGLDPASGAVKWTQGSLKDQYGNDATTLPVVSPDDVTVPTRLDGALAGGYHDGRIVQLTDDAQARVINTGNGKLGALKSNAGDNVALATAYDGRLYIAANSGAHTVSSYSLTDFGNVQQIYQPDQSHYLKALAPCGGNMCVLDLDSLKSETAQVIAADPHGGNKTARHAKAPGTNLLVPVADGVLAQDTDSGHESTVLLAPDGKDRLGNRGAGRLAVRLSAGSVLLLSGTPGTYPTDQSLFGFGVHSGDWKSIGDVQKVRSAGCSWNTHMIICPGDKDFGIWRFAS